MKRENYEAIMGADIKGRAPGALVRSDAALSAIDSMRRAGWTFAEMSERSGVSARTLHSLAYRRPARVTQRVNDALCRAWRERNRKRATSLEEWQWREARADFAHGATAATLAERYGVSESTVSKHMKKYGIVWASAC